MGWLNLAGWVLASFFLFQWLEARDAVLEERSGCNESKLEETLEAERELHAAQRAADQLAITQLMDVIDDERRGKELAEEIARQANTDLASTRADIQRITREARNADVIPTIDPLACLDTPAPTDIVNGLRQLAQGCGETGNSDTDDDATCTGAGGID